MLGFAPAALLVAVAFFSTNWIAHRTLEPAYLHRGGADNWYDYTYERNGRQVESYWRNPVGVDRGEPSRSVYAVNVLVGHHGVFSLTPVWLLAFVGMAVWMWRGHDPRLRWLAAAVPHIAACLAFYLGQPPRRNYGGVTCNLRWMFWLAAVVADNVAVVDALGGGVDPTCPCLLAFSVLSASYPIWNPWTHPG